MMMHHALLALSLLLQAPAAPAAPVAPKPAAARAGAGATVRYEAAFQIEAKKWSVTVTVAPPETGPFEFWIPRWTPGGYHLVEFAQFVDEVKAFDPQGKALEVAEQDEPRHWTIDPKGAKEITIRYTADHASAGMLDMKAMDVEANRITKTHAYVNVPSLFGFVPGTLDWPIELRLALPAGWKAATALRKNEAGAFVAPSFYRFEDSPILMSPELQVADFEAAGVPHQLAVVGRTEAQTASLAKRCARIAEAGRKVMGSLPYDHYVFLVGFLPEGGMGGLEHSESTLILMPDFAGFDDEVNHLFAHEYFHLWCAERIQVEALRKPDYTKPMVTGTLYLNEGCTEYMQLQVLYQAGLLDERGFYDEVSKKNGQIQAMRKASAGKSQIEYSRGWTHASLPEFMALSVSIYERGAVNFFALDAWIRAKSEGKRGLVDGLRYLMAEYHEKGKGFPEEDLPAIFTKATGVDCAGFFEKFVAGRELPDLDDFLAPYGLKCLRNAKGRPTAGGFQDVEPVTDAQRALRQAFFSLPAERAAGR